MDTIKQSSVNNSVLIFLSISLGSILDYFSFAPYGQFAHYMAIISSLFVIYPMLGFVINRKLDNIFILTFITLNWVYFLSPFILEEKTTYPNRIINEVHVDEIAFYCACTIILINFGYFFFFKSGVRPLSSTKLKFNEKALKDVIYLFIILGILFRVGQQLVPNLLITLSNLIQLLTYGPTIVFGLYVLYLIRFKAKLTLSFFHIVVLTFISTEFLIQVSSTLFSKIIVFVSGAFFVYIREKKKLPLIHMGVLFILLTPIYQTRKYFRLEDKQTTNAGLSKFEKGQVLLKSAYEVQSSNETVSELDKDKLNRFENLSLISHVVSQHKIGTKEFLNGSTFFWLPLVPIPRMLFPDKPRNVMSTTVATEYGLRGRLSNASINFPMLVEAYANFDFIGMCVLALLFGASYKWFVLKFGGGLGDINLLIIINSLKQFTHAEGNITLVFGALIQVYLFWWVLMRVINLEKYQMTSEEMEGT